MSMNGNNVTGNSNRNPIGRDYYNASDASQFIVRIQKEQRSPNDNTSIHPISFGYFI